MRLKNKLMPAMLFFGVLALWSCEKNDQDAISPSHEKQKQLTHIMADSAEITSYNFAGTKLSQINNYNRETGEVETFEKFVRDPKGNILTSTTYNGKNHEVLSEQKYSYNSKNQLTQTTTAYYNGSNLEYSAYTTFAYNEQKKLEKKTVYEGTEPKEGEKAKVKSYTTYEVLPNGNYSQELQFVVDSEGNASLFSTTTYAYDASRNPFYELAEPGTASSPNNLVATTTLVHGSKKTYKYTFAYTYDGSGLPTGQTVISPNGNRETLRYLYSN